MDRCHLQSGWFGPCSAKWMWNQIRERTDVTDVILMSLYLQIWGCNAKSQKTWWKRDERIFAFSVHTMHDAWVTGCAKAGSQALMPQSVAVRMATVTNQMSLFVHLMILCNPQPAALPREMDKVGTKWTAVIGLVRSLCTIRSKIGIWCSRHLHPDSV